MYLYGFAVTVTPIRKYRFGNAVTVNQYGNSVMVIHKTFIVFLTNNNQNKNIMTTKQSILKRLHSAVNGTEKDFYDESQLEQFANSYIDKWDENTSEEVIAESFVDFWWHSDCDIRRCSECGDLMREGFCYNDGEAYYCGENCLHKHFTNEEWEEECDDNDCSYYTDWY